MNLLSLQERDYKFSCQNLEGIEITHLNNHRRWGLFMHCHTINDTDSYLMDYCALKTLRDNAERLLISLDKAIGLIEDE